MELREPIDWINQRLLSDYGRAEDGRPNFRIVFSDDQFENRITEYTDEGFQLLHPEVRQLPKYRHYIQAMFVLERLVPVGEETDLLTKTSYEPAWVFQDNKGNYLPPWYDGCKLIIESIYQAMNGSGNFAKYKDPNDSEEMRQKKLADMEVELFGNETNVGDALAYDYGVTVPENTLLKESAKKESIN